MKSVLTVRNGDWQQENYETASGNARKRARQLRKLGYKVVVSRPETQITPAGRVKLTMLTVLNADDNIPMVEEFRFPR